MQDNEMFSQVAKELAAGNKDEGLWLKAFALENGDPEKAKAHYVRMRIEQIQKLHSEVSYGNCSTSANLNDGIKDNKASTVKVFLYIVLALAIAGPTVKYLDVSDAKTPATPPLTEVKPTQPIDPVEEMRQAGIYFNPVTYTVYLNGEITKSTAYHFDKVVNDPMSIRLNKQLRVELNSPGGDMYAAMAIGRTMRKLERSSVAIVAKDAKCYSACVFILAAGQQRIRLGSIGIHRPYSSAPSADKHLTEQWFDQMSADAKAYLREMRVRESLYDDMISISPSDLYIFHSPEEMDHYGLIQIDPIVEEQVTAVWMKKYGINDRAIIMERKNNAIRNCLKGIRLNGIEYTAQECFDAFMTGQLQSN